MCIHMPEENWLAMLEFVPRRVLGNKVDKVGNRYFAKIAQDCLHSPFKHNRIGDLYIDTNAADNRALLLKMTHTAERVPIADVDMPENIKGFDNIAIRNLDSVGLQFLRRMRALFHNIVLNYNIVDACIHPRFMARAALTHRDLLPLIHGPVELIEVGPVFLTILRESFAATLFDTKSLDIYISRDISNDLTTADVLADWLFTPLRDGQPRVLMLYVSHNLHAVQDDLALAIEFEIAQQMAIFFQQRFMDQTRQQASPFFAVFRNNQTMNHLDSITENGQTEEKLIIRGSGHHLVVFNCAAGVDPQSEWMAQKEREMIDSNPEILDTEKKRSTFIFT